MPPVYAEGGLIRAPLRPSPSALYNNLACAEGNLVFAHNRSHCIFNPDALTPLVAAAVRRGESQAHDSIYSVQACHVSEGVTYVVIGTDAGLQVWDKTCSTLLYVWTIPETERLPATSSIATFVRGAAVVRAADGTNNIVFGTSSGRIFALRVDAGNQFSTPEGFSHQSAPITCMGSDLQSRRGAWSAECGSTFVSCDQEGLVTVWSASSSSDLKVVASISASSSPTTAVAVRRDLLLLGRLDGTVQVYSLSALQLQVEITAHARFLTAMDLHPTKDIIATVSEDATLNVWTLPTKEGGGKVQNLFSSIWMHAMLTGVMFCGAGNDSVAALALDTEEVRVYKPT